MKAPALLGGLLIGVVTLAGAQTWCFSKNCGQVPNLNFTAGHDYEHLPQFGSTPIKLPPYRPVLPLEPLAATKPFFQLGTPALRLPPPAVEMPVLVTPAPAPSLPAPVISNPMPAPVTPSGGSFSTGTGLPSFTPR